MSKTSNKLKPYFELAIQNITSFGDTDIFPLPFENHVLFDRRDNIVKQLCSTFDEFDERFSSNPPQNISSLSPVGLGGFRWAAQIDPFWNAYFLGLVLSISETIEKNRISKSLSYVFSYRIDLDTKNGKLFDDDFGFREFLQHSRKLAEEYKFVSVTDISDCYSRISHHQIENALQQIKINPSITYQILKFLKNSSNDKSYGLPIGGPASRILVELTLGLTDELLKQNGFRFCRFADDYHIFVNSEAEAYKALIFLSEKLARNEVLSLQKSKTRTMSSSEFLSMPDLFSIEADPESSHPIKGLLKISLRFDPYSPTAEEDYEALRDEIDKIDLIHLLNLEFAKSRIHSNFTKRIVNAIRHARSSVKNDASMMLLENLPALFPIFPTVAITLRTIFEELNADVQSEICRALCKLIRDNNPIVLSEVHLAYAIRILSLMKNAENNDTLVAVYNSQLSQLLRKDIILMMANWNNYPWLYDVKNVFVNLSLWERRAFIVSSYMMGDAGSHWRDGHKDNFSEFEIEVRDWAADKKQKSKNGWSVPL